MSRTRDRWLAGTVAFAGACAGACVTAGLGTMLGLYRDLVRVAEPTGVQHVAAAVLAAMFLVGIGVTCTALWAAWHLFRSAMTGRPLPRSLGGGV